MSKRVLVTTFADEDDLLRTAHDFRNRGLKVVDAFSPYPVHGLDEAIGLPPSRLSWICAAFGIIGAGAMLWFQCWTSAVDWPLNVGGKPLHSLPAFVPVIFESLVLAAGLGSVAAFLLRSRLLPGRQSQSLCEGLTSDRFGLVVEQTDASFDLDEVRTVLDSNHALLVEERVLHDEPTQGHDHLRATSTLAPERETARLRRFAWLNVGLATALAVVVVAAIAMSRNPNQRHWEFLPNMVWSPAYDAYAAQENLPLDDGPVPGTRSREEQPLYYEATEVDAKRAGQELTNPFPADDAEALRRGGFVFNNFCAACHGPNGQGDGPVAKRGYPPPPAFATGPSAMQPDGELFHVITFGRRSMPPHASLVNPDDRWKAILHIRKLQGKPSEPAQPADAAATNASPAGPTP